MNSNRIEVEFGARTTELNQGSKEAASSVRAFGDAARAASEGISRAFSGIGESMAGLKISGANLAQSFTSSFAAAGNALSTIQAPLFALAGLVAGGAFFKEAIGESTKLTGEANKLARALGITTDEAATLNTALGDIYTDSDTYISAFQQFARQLRTNEDGLKALGIETRDANGHLRDSNTLFREAVAKVGEYKPGLDQAMVAQTMFGRSIDDVMKLQKLNNDVLEDAKQKNQELGLVITRENVEASKKYKAAMNDVGDVMSAVWKTVGDAVMPVFTDLANYFARTGPTVIGIFKGALSGVLLAFYSGRAIVESFANGIFEAFNTIIEAGGLVGETLSRLLSGDFAGAKDSAIGAANRIGQGFKRAFLTNISEAVGEAGQAFAKAMDNMWAGGTKADQKPKGGGGNAPPGKGGSKPEEPKSQMAAFEEQLSQARAAAAELDAIHGMTKAQELAFWQQIMGREKLVAADRIAVAKKVAEARVSMLKEEAKASEQMDKIRLESSRDRMLAEVEQQEESAKQMLATGEITQKQLLALEQQFENERFAIKQAALSKAAEVLDPQRDPVQVQQIHAQLEQLEQQHQLRLAQIRGQVAVQSAEEQNQIWKDLGGRMSGLWDKGVGAMMNGTLTWRNATKAIGTELTGWFAGVVKKKVVSWVFGEQAQTAATAAGTAQRVLIEAGAALKTVGIWVATGLKTIMVSAYQAMAAAWAAISAIPIVGPFLAPVVAAGAFAGVVAIAGKLSSAEGGYDIPAGVNPITQLHEQEMVLPAEHANTIRALGAGGLGGAAGGGDVHLHMKGTSMGGGFFMVHKSEMVKALKAARSDLSF